MDDQAEYQELSRKLVSTVDDGSEPIAKHFAAWTASLSPDALDDYARAIELAKAAVEQDPADQQYLTGLGAIHLRAGQYEQAMTWLNQALEAAANDKTSNAYAKFLLAMTQHRLERFDEASQTLSEAIEVAEAELNDPVNVPAWNRKLTIELLRDEAAMLIDGSGKNAKE